MEQFRGKSFRLHASILLFSAKAENAANRPGYHEFFVGAHNFSNRVRHFLCHAFQP
jgi:hypothetical protein